MQKILILGCGGSGKSTLALELSKKLNVPVIHLDQAYWKPNWVKTETEEWETVVKEIMKRPTWVMDGNYGGTMDMRLKVADTVIFLKMPTWLCLYRVIKRTLQYYGQSRPTMTKGCPERWSWEFYHYILFYNKTRTPNILKKLKVLPVDKKVFIINSSKEKSDFLKKI